MHQDQHLTRLFPTPSRTCALHGLYLDHELHTRGGHRPFVYSNFVTSLDGRIAIESGDRLTHTVPSSIANARDWRLYQELAGQADILITSGRFFRQSSLGEAQDVLPVGNSDLFADIRSWRLEQGLAPQPDIAILSNSLDIPLGALEPYRARHIIVATSNNADTARIQHLEQEGIEVIHSGNNRVQGDTLVSMLGASGYRSLYAIAGPAVFHTLAEAGVVDRLYMTIACRLLGGTAFDTLTRGDLLTPPASMRMAMLHLDTFAPEGSDQLLCVFDREPDQSSDD